jgi:predicted transcriptional regulator
MNTEGTAMAEATVKDQLHELADKLPDDATWRDVARELYVRREIEIGLEQAERGELIPQAEVEKKFLGE